MDEDTKQAVAVFRFGVIADLAGRKGADPQGEVILPVGYSLLDAEPHQPLHHPLLGEGLRERGKKA